MEVAANDRRQAAPTSQTKGTVIVYATDPGNVAADGCGRNGLFTAGVLTRVSEEVERGSEQKQTPYINGPATLQEEFHFGQGTQVASLEPVPAPAQPAAHTRKSSEENVGVPLVRRNDNYARYRISCGN